MLAGDVMQHGMQLRASTRADGEYTWEGVFSAISPLFEAADLSLANLETPIAGGAVGYSGFPHFNAPECVLEALTDAGFDVLQTANNHCLDRGRDGLFATLDALDRHGFAHTGTFRSAADRDAGAARVQLSDGTVVAVLANTYSTNGEPMPPGEPWTVNWLDEGRMEADIARARREADLVIVGLHWGLEYHDQPEAWQTRLAQSLVNAGADVVWGQHPHVVQPAVRMQAEDGREALVLYSLGNFISNQRDFRKDGGLVARVRVGVCAEHGASWIQAVRFVPVWVDDRTQSGTLSFALLPVPDATQGCLGMDRSDVDCARMAGFRAHVAGLIPDAVFDLEPWRAPAPGVADPLLAAWVRRVPTGAYAPWAEPVGLSAAPASTAKRPMRQGLWPVGPLMAQGDAVQRWLPKAGGDAIVAP